MRPHGWPLPSPAARTPIESLTNPASALACDTDDAVHATRSLLDAARSASVPVFFTTVVYDEVGEAAAAVFLRKVPALKILRPGTRWVEIDARLPVGYDGAIEVIRTERSPYEMELERS